MRVIPSFLLSLTTILTFTMTARGQEADTIVGHGEYYDSQTGNAYFHAYSQLVPFPAQDLGTLSSPNMNSYARAINGSGDVAGYSELPDGSTHATLWPGNGSGPQDLGTLGGRNSYAYGISETGAIVGCADTDQGSQHAFLWMNAAMTDLGTLGTPPGRNSCAYAVSPDGGMVVGQTDRDGSAYRPHAFVWQSSSSQMTDLGDLDGPPETSNLDSIAYGTDGASIVGCSWTMNTPNGLGNFHAFITFYPGGSMQDLGTLGDPNGESCAYGVSGIEIVGYFSLTADSYPQHAIVWGGSNPIDLGTLGGQASIAYGVSISGVVVGTADRANSNHAAFLWYPNEAMIDLAWGPFGQFSSSEAHAVTSYTPPDGQLSGHPR